MKIIKLYFENIVYYIIYSTKITILFFGVIDFAGTFTFSVCQIGTVFLIKNL